MVTDSFKMKTPSTLPTLLLLLLAGPSLGLTPDPSGASKVGNGAHQSTVGSQCTSSLDCGANGNIACCAFLPQAGGATIGICSGCGATTQQGKQGCGFGDAGKTSLAADPQVCPASSFAAGAAPGSSSSPSSTPGAAASAAAAAAQAAPPSQQQQQPAAAPAAAAATAASPPSSCTQPKPKLLLARHRATPHERRAAAQLLAHDLLPPYLKPRAQPLPDPSLDAGAGNGRHAQFVTGRCASARDCGAGQADLGQVCCASVPADAATGGGTVGVCSGSAVGNVAPKMGCGFGDGLANSAVAAGMTTTTTTTTDPACESPAAAAVASPAAAPAAQAAAAAPGAAKLPDPSLDAGKGNQQNKQFVTGACINAKDCGASQADLANVCCASVMGSDGQVVGVCSGSAVGNAAPKMGCGFGDGKASSAAA